VSATTTHTAAASATVTTDLGSAALKVSPGRLVSFLRSEGGKRGIRYAAVSAVAIVVSLAVLGFCYGVLHLSASASQTVAVIASTIPSYYLNRAWVWGRNGKSHLWKEIVPFWVISVGQYLISVVVINFGEEHVVAATDSKGLQTLGLQLISLFTYGVMWVAKFAIFNKVLFAHRPARAD
jgi:putative flippase GtrA